MPKLSVELISARQKMVKGKIKVGKIVDDLSVNGHMLPSLFCAIPFLLPFPIPGLSSILGGLVVVFGLAMMLSLPPWIPQKVRNISIGSEQMQSIFDKLAWVSQKFEVFFKPRWLAISKHSMNYQLNGFVISACGLILALPLPPGTNLPPAVIILLLAIADIEDDGLLIFIGYLLFLGLLAILGFLVLFGVHFYQ